MMLGMIAGLHLKTSYLFEKHAGNGADVRPRVSPEHSAYGVRRWGTDLGAPGAQPRGLVMG